METKGSPSPLKRHTSKVRDPLDGSKLTHLQSLKRSFFGVGGRNGRVRRCLALTYMCLHHRSPADLPRDNYSTQAASRLSIRPFNIKLTISVDIFAPSKKTILPKNGRKDNVAEYVLLVVPVPEHDWNSMGTLPDVGEGAVVRFRRLHSETPLVSVGTPLALPRGGADK